MRILILNQPFWPDVVATAQHMADWSEHLTARGHQVTVIASRSVYGRQGAVLPKTDNYKGAKIYRVGSNLFRKGGFLTRMVDFGLFHLRALWRAMTLPRQDVVVCLTTPPFIGLIGMLLKSLRGSRYVQYEMDLYPDISIALGVMKPHSMAARLCERIHRQLLHSADRVIVLGRCMHRVIVAKGIAAEKLALVTPWADPDEIRPIPRTENPFRSAHALNDQFVVMYAGNLGLGHDTQTILGAMQRLNADAAVKFVFVGGGRRISEIRQSITDMRLSNALILDYAPREELAQVLSAADVHLITQAPGTAGLIVPSKFYGILAAGRPSIYIGPADTEIAYTLAEESAGRVLAIGDVDGLVAAIQALRQSQSENASTAQSLSDRVRAVLHHQHTRQQCVSALTAIVESLAPAATH